jgi:uncharacterized C2H2 Zn-finger protein
MTTSTVARCPRCGNVLRTCETCTKRVCPSCQWASHMMQCFKEQEQVDHEHQVIFDLLVAYGNTLTNSDLVELAANEHELCLTWAQVADIRHDLFFMQLAGGR